MTKEIQAKLARLQFLHSVYDRANEISAAIDPKRRKSNCYDSIAHIAADQFLIECRVHPSIVTMTDLSTENPAPDILSALKTL